MFDVNIHGAKIGGVFWENKDFGGQVRNVILVISRNLFIFVV